MATLKYSVVDAFTTVHFKGNGAAVIVQDPAAGFDNTVLQNIATEFNLSETAFVTPVDTSEGRFALRWFTPKVEVALCGHATLASAFAVKTVEFTTISGVLTARSLPDGRIELEFPAGETTAVDETLQHKVIEVVQQAFPAESQPQVRYIGTGHGISFSKYLLIEVSGVDLQTAVVQPALFTKLAESHTIIIITQRGRSPHETFASRVFAPACGIPEDPVMGSAHGLIAPYWAKLMQLGDVEMVGTQVGARSGVVGVWWDRGKETCKLRGHGVLAAKRYLYLPN